MLIKLFAPREYDNPDGRRILGEEFDKALEEVKKKIEDETPKDKIPNDPR